jgi:hypothetical protein
MHGRTSAGEKERLDGFSLKNVVRKKMTCIVCHLLLSERKGYNMAGKDVMSLEIDFYKK